jgi:hypothetical protein
MILPFWLYSLFISVVLVHHLLLPWYHHHPHSLLLSSFTIKLSLQQRRRKREEDIRKGRWDISTNIFDILYIILFFVRLNLSLTQLILSLFHRANQKKLKMITRTDEKRNKLCFVSFLLTDFGQFSRVFLWSRLEFSLFIIFQDSNYPSLWENEEKFQEFLSET